MMNMNVYESYTCLIDFSVNLTMEMLLSNVSLTCDFVYSLPFLANL